MRDTASAAPSRVTPGQVANPFRVDRATVTRWATTGRTASALTLDGLRRGVEAEVCEFLGRVPTQVR
ncbi:hypothetical protein [Cellulomonas sp. KRMCY2]|uniref:hypothetical protein n=1 Tax=Cellulomonas sp. KRMCY2 TaxID=1304865 RepID=UPI00045E76A9|nr:hypothetical protein [Cellulomonas sp. KRMCY2]